MNDLGVLLTQEWLKEALSDWGYSTLTEIQRKALELGVTEGQSLIVSAPTSSGKTLIAELAALAAVKSGTRVLYLVSHRALADQKYEDFEKRFEDKASVGLSTGDRSLGAADAQVRVATYEKAIGLLLSGSVVPSNTLVIADEAQILCDPSRGPDIEAFCSVLRQRGVKQFLALTATISNPEDLAGWMNCASAISTVRSTPLHQEVWFENLISSITFGRELGSHSACPINRLDLFKLIEHLLGQGKAPILVFVETRRRAAELADDFMRTRPRTVEGIKISEQLELYSEPTESTDRLRKHVERAVAFHTADLSAQERQVLEAGFKDSRFDVCFATSTLAAGVNFPFRTIVFPDLTYRHRQPGERLSMSDYRNMSGRAGRLGLHPEGFSILLPKDGHEKAHADKLVQPTNEHLHSVLLSLSLRKTILSLIASRIISSIDSIDDFFKNTLLWHQQLSGNPEKQQKLLALSREAVRWLIANKLVVEDDLELKVKGLGRAAAISGLLPETAVAFSKQLVQHREIFEKDFDEHIDGLIYMMCTSAEFKADKPSRFLPPISGQAFGALDFWYSRKMLVRLDTADWKTAQCARAISLYISGEGERHIAHATGISSGYVQRFGYEIAWVLEGLHRIATAPELGLPQATSNKISLLARQVRWGVPVNTLDMLRVAEQNRVPGVGRQRAMELVKAGFNTMQDLVTAGKQKLTEILKNALRAEALIAGASQNGVPLGEKLGAAHQRVAQQIGLEEIVERCYRETGHAYEQAIKDLLDSEESLSVMVLDTPKRPNVPDFILEAANLKVLLECKTKMKLTALLNKEEAWAVSQKSNDFDIEYSRVTLGKPGFDETSKAKVAAAPDITLVENASFIEAFLRVKLGQISSVDFLKWLSEPGLAEIERLAGTSTYTL